MFYIIIHETDQKIGQGMNASMNNSRMNNSHNLG